MRPNAVSRVDQPLGCASTCLCSLIVGSNPIILIDVQGADGNTTILSNQPDELLPDILHLVVLAEKSDVVIDSRRGWLSGSQIDISLVFG